MIFELNRVVEQLAKEKGLPKEVVWDLLKKSVEQVAKKRMGEAKIIEVEYDQESDRLVIQEIRKVVEDVENPDTEISLKDARKIDPDFSVGEEIIYEKEPVDLGRIGAHQVKQILIQKLKEEEKNSIYNEYISRKGEIVSGIVRRVEKKAIVVDLGKSEAFVNFSDLIPGEMFTPGDRVRAYLEDVEKGNRGTRILLSRNHPQFLAKLLESQVPEIYEGTITVMGIARDTGNRSKVAVKCRDTGIDPIGACIGYKGSRIQGIVQELRNEKIDMVLWDDDIVKYICNALAPAEITKLTLDENERSAEIIVPDNQLAIAVGKRGANIKLASRLTGWKLSVNSESKVAKTSKDIDAELAQYFLEENLIGQEEEKKPEEEVKQEETKLQEEVVGDESK
jgi:N utilization substance protein A